MILVTGGNGYVGSALCRRLAEGGHEVCSISRRQYDTKGYLSLVGDVSDKASLETIFASYPVETVVHLASMLNTASRQHPDQAVRINVVGSLNLMEVCREHGTRRFIFGSSFNAIGPRPGRLEAVDEREPALPGEFYGETKRFVEQLGVSLADLGAFEFVSARMSIIVGPGEPSPTSAWRTDMFNLLRDGGRVQITFAPDEVIPLAHFQDIADSIAVLVLAGKPAHQIYHLPCESWRVCELAAMIADVGRNLRVECGSRPLEGIPPVVSWEWLRREFGFEAQMLRERLVAYREESA
jgi:UDP-glucose 4-epimerase